MVKPIYLCIFCLLVLTACGSARTMASSSVTPGEAKPTSTPSFSPTSIPNSPTPSPVTADSSIAQTSTRTRWPITPLTPSPTRTRRPTSTLTPTPTPVTPTPTATPFTTTSFPIQPVNGAGKWELYNSPNSIRVLLFDGVSMWAGSEAGGLVQWDPQALTAVRHTQASGFPLNTVYDLAYDAATGYLYAVGDAGLAIWDGKQWYHRRQQQLGFEPDLPLTAVAVEQGTVIWVGGEEDPPEFWVEPEIENLRGGGLAHGNWATNTWQRYTTEDGLPSNQVNDLASDTDGNIWIASSCFFEYPTCGGITRITPEGEIHTDYFRYNDGVILEKVDSVVVAENGVVYAGATVLYSLSPGSSEWFQVGSASIWSSGQVVVDSQNQAWLVLEHDVINLPSPSREATYVLSEPEIFDGPITAAIDGEGHIWYGDTAGLYELAGEEVYSRLLLAALPQNRVSAVAVNGDGSVWLRSGRDYGEEHEYISQIANGQITHYMDDRLAIQAAYPWTGRDALWPVAPDGRVWFRDDRVLWGYDGEQWLDVALPDTVGEDIFLFTIGSNGVLIVVSNTGLSLYDPLSGWKPPTWLASDAHPYSEKCVMDENHQIWLSPSYGYFMAESDVYRYSLETGEWASFGEQDNGLIYIPPRGVSLSPTGEVWVVSEFAGVSIYHPDGLWESLLREVEYPDTDRYTEVYFQTANDVWFTAISSCGFEADCIDGLVYYDGTRWVRLTAANSGLIHDEVYDIAFDESGNVWLATAAGLQRTTAGQAVGP